METTRTGPAGEIVDTPRHRALASASRVAILRHVRAAPAGLTTADVAATTGLHLSTVRAHLDRLVEAGLLVKARARAGTPGRPAWRYRGAAPDPAPGSYRGLAEALLEQVAGDGADGTGAANGTGAAARAGERWGRRLAAETPGADPVDGVRRVLDRLGFAPRLAQTGRLGDDTAELHLYACPFLDLVAAHPDAMCGLHEGVVRGAVAGFGRPVADSTTLEPFGAPTACVVRLAAPRGPDRAPPR